MTDHCYDTSAPAWKESSTSYDESSVMLETKIVAEELLGSYPKDLDAEALKKGCEIARAIRVSIFKSLGFTLSAGISANKTVAKLASAMGKPNGQAVIVSQAIPFVSQKEECPSLDYVSPTKYCLRCPPDSE